MLIKETQNLNVKKANIYFAGVEGRNYVAYIPVPINDDEEGSDSQTDEEYYDDDDEYYDEVHIILTYEEFYLQGRRGH